MRQGRSEDFGKGSTICSGATDSVARSASEAARGAARRRRLSSGRGPGAQPPVGVWGRSPQRGVSSEQKS